MAKKAKKTERHVCTTCGRASEKGGICCGKPMAKVE